MNVLNKCFCSSSSANFSFSLLQSSLFRGFTISENTWMDRRKALHSPGNGHCSLVFVEGFVYQKEALCSWSTSIYLDE